MKIPNICRNCGYSYEGNCCPNCGWRSVDVSNDFIPNWGKGMHPISVLGEKTIQREPGHAIVSNPKLHFSYYYQRYRVCKNCGEYVPYDDVCPACGKDELEIVIEDKYFCSNRRRCDNCSYESWKLHRCPKCGGEMILVLPYLIGDFTSMGEHMPDVTDCSEDEEVLEISESIVYFNATPQNCKKIYVTCNYIDWYVQDYPKWVTIDKEKINSVSIAVLQNKENKDRTARIEIICGKKKKELIVYQYA